MIRSRTRRPATARKRAKLLASAAKLGNPKAAYNLALLYLDGQTFPQDLKRAAELLRVAADAGNPEAQYALATFYKEGTGVEGHRQGGAAAAGGLARRQCRCRGRIRHRAVQRHRHAKNEAAAVALLRKAARQNSPIAQNRLARVLVNGAGAPVDKVEGLKWQSSPKPPARAIPCWTRRCAGLSPEERAKAQEAARKWLGTQMMRLDAAHQRRAPSRLTLTVIGPSSDSSPSQARSCCIPPLSTSWSRPRAAPAAASSATSAKSRICRFR